jgi:hypothetical protein
MSIILCKFPSRSRPTRFLEVLKEWVRMADDLLNIHWLFSFDHDDDSMAGMGEHINALGIDATIVRGTSNTKVEAINRDFQHAPPWDIVLVVSDDMWPKVQGWDTMIRARVAENPDSLIWYFDGKQKDIITLPLMDRAYYERDGHVYDPRFESVFCDNLQTDLARHRGRLVFIDAVLAEHRHPANFSEVKKDALYEQNETQAIWDRDQATYHQLRDEMGLI